MHSCSLCPISSSTRWGTPLQWHSASFCSRKYQQQRTCITRPSLPTCWRVWTIQLVREASTPVLARDGEARLSELTGMSLHGFTDGSVGKLMWLCATQHGLKVISRSFGARKVHHLRLLPSFILLAQSRSWNRRLR